MSDFLHHGGIGKIDVVEQAASEECIRQFLFAVAGDHHNGTMLGLEMIAGFHDIETHLIQFKQQIIGKLEVRLVDLIDEKHDLILGTKRFAQFPQFDVLPDIGNILVVKARIIQPLHGIVDIQSVALPWKWI